MTTNQTASKPVRPVSAFEFFQKYFNDEYKKIKPNVNLDNPDLSERCRSVWAELTEDQKRIFETQAATDMQRYRTEMEQYQPASVNKKTPKKKKDPNAPKKPLTAFFWFLNDNRPKVKANNPTLGVIEVARELGRQWAVLDPKVKLQYHTLAVKDKDRYKCEMSKYLTEVCKKSD